MEIKIVRKVLEANEKLAAQIRERNRRYGITMFNIMSSPGSGKTSIIEQVLPKLKNEGYKIGVIEGDITSSLDAERMLKFDVPVSQINTEPFGGDCHLGSEVILPALEQLDSNLDIVFIENVGNLVCPAEFDTGADFNIVVLSITEGEDKPLKYPLMFRVCDIAIINKIDLLPYLDVDLDVIKKNIKKIKPEIDIIPSSAKSKEGIYEVASWIKIHLLKE